MHSGFDLYLVLCRRILLLWPAYPVLLLGRLTGIGPVIYRSIAARRRSLFGVCAPSRISSADFIPRDVSAEIAMPAALLWPTTYLAAYVLFMATYLVGTLPAAALGRTTFWIHQLQMPSVFRAGFDFGFNSINVFNKSDLGMEYNFMTIEAQNAAGRRELLPLLSERGERLEWHTSDRFYYGLSLPWRRATVKFANYCLESGQREIKRFFMPAAQLALRTDYRPPFYLTFHSYNAWDYARLRDPSHKSFIPKVVCEIVLDENGTVISRTEFQPINIPRNPQD
jgi:hypothetical protein